MSNLERVGTLQLEQDLRFQHLEWRIEKIGKILVAVFLLAALSGVFGSGYLSRAKRSSRSGSLVVQYDRFARRDAPSNLLIDAQGLPNSEIRIWFGPQLQAMKVERVTPEQVRTETSPSRTTFAFRTREDGRARVRFHVEPQTAGRLESSIGIEGGDAVSFWSLIYP